MRIKNVETPIGEEEVRCLKIGDMIEITGCIYTGRDAILPKVVDLIKNGKLDELGIDLRGTAIFHSAVSPAGVGPTSSNKFEIEANIPELSKEGVKLHLGKGALSKNTVEALHRYNSVFAVVPPVTALLSSRIKEQVVVAFHEEGMESMHLLSVEDFPAIVTVAHGESLYDR